MIEYLYNAIRATAAQDITLTAILTDADGKPIETNCALMLHNDTDMIGKYNGIYLINGVWNFTIPAEATKDLTGRFWYCICEKNSDICFKQPIYLV